MQATTADETAAHVPESCDRRGKPLAAEPWWMYAPGRAEHERCRDWSQHPFPFTRHLRALRAIAKTLDPFQAEVHRLGHHLADLERTWPNGGLEAVQDARKQLAALEGRFADLQARGAFPRLT